MTGKSYQIKEMKSIVDYLTANKLYGEVRARKMWMDFANTQLTTRTWQSLKETFLKRILPDIHNPYYNLSIEQINSFRSGYDVVDKNTNKLEIHTVSDDSNDQNDNNTAQSNNDYGIKEEIMAGENIKCSKIPSRNRSSADTVIVETCYETAEDIQKDLESPGGDKEIKSLRDCITYSEPLTPMLQEVLDDFQSEPENEPEASDRDSQMEVRQNVSESENIDKDTSTTVEENGKLDQGVNGNLEKATDPAVTAVKEKDPIQDSDKTDKSKDKQSKNTQHSVSDEKDDDVVCLDDSSPGKNVTESAITGKHTDDETLQTSKEQLTEIPDTDIPKTNHSEEVTVVHDSNSEIIHPTGALNISNNTPDASLPNNPEALKKRTSDEKDDTKSFSSENKTDNKISRKRSNSEDTTKNSQNKKKKLFTKKTKATSETEGNRKIQTIAEVNPKISEDQPMVDVSVANKIDKPQQSKESSSPGTSAQPSTSIANDIDKILLTSDSDQSPNSKNTSDIKNPCLQNVSLFDEQFKKAKYNTSESEAESKKKKTEVIGDKNEENKTNKAAEKQKDVVMLKSHTDTDTEEPTTPPKKKLRPGVVSSKTDRDKALGNIFGFSSGAGNSKRKKQRLSTRRRTISQNNISRNGGSNSSEWESEIDSEVYVSPPRARKNRPTRKYLKPQCGRIIPLEEEGGLFVMYGKKIYPLVKDGKLVKNYLNYLPDSDSEEDQNYWKLKYEEEKKKAAELKKLLKGSKYSHSRASTSSATPLSPPRASRASTSQYNRPEETSNNLGKEICVAETNEQKPEAKASTSENIKIKFATKNNQEIHLEGGWPLIQNVLEHVVNIFHKEPQPVSQPKAVVEPPCSSGISTPVVITAIHEPGVDPEVHEKVNKIENEIFKEIEERDKEEGSEPNGLEPNITKRKAGRPRKSSQSSAPQSPAKKLKLSDQAEAKEPKINGERIEETGNNVTSDESKKLDDVTNDESKKLNDVTNNESKKPNVATSNKSKEAKDAATDDSKKRIRTPRRNLDDALKNSDTTTVTTRRSKLNTSKTSAGNEDEEIRYMFPPKITRQTAKTPTDKTSKQKPQKSAPKAPKIPSSPDTVCSNSLESTQGYQDTDPSPMKHEFRKKKMINLSEMKSKTISHVRRSNRKKAQSFSYSEAGSSNLSLGDSNKVERVNSTLNSDVYRSDSYQLLMPGSKNTFQQLEPIDETSPVGNEVEFITHVDSTAKNEVFSVQLNTISRNSGQIDSDFGSSSNISLPLSPELSVVESLSVSKELLNTCEGPTLNEMQCNEMLVVPATCSQYMISEIDVSVPLMQQECGLESSIVAPSKDANKPHNIVTESLLKKIGTINITDQSNVSDNLDIKLRDLFLESAKKMAAHNQINDMDIDETNVEPTKKSKNKKRSSTPRKRNNSTKSKKVPKVQDVVEEEHVESFAKGGRQSCPPIIQTLVPEEEMNIANLTINENAKSKGKKKKDIIKVKILRPKSKKSANDTAKSIRVSSQKSTCTDSGINDTESGVFLRGDESVDLIHNHSETCLHANECIDSIEFVENSLKSSLTLSDSMRSVEDILWQDQCEFGDAQNILPDFFCNNAQDVKSFYDPKPDDIENCESETVYHSPLGTESSLITEDLSDELPETFTNPNKWYLLSEDETTNTNMGNVREPPVSVASYGANLKQIFPITCAVPDLSTITEMSGDNDSSRKQTLEGVSSDFNSKNSFN